MKKSAKESVTKSVSKKAVSEKAPKAVLKEVKPTQAESSANFWGKLGTWVKEKVDCCLEG